MKVWILAAVVAGVLIMVGVPAVALTVASHDGDGRAASSGPQHHSSKGPDASHRMWKHHHHWGPPGFGPGGGHRTFKPPKLSTKQRDALADRLDQRATQLHKAATCLRQKSDVAQCLKSTFPPGGFSRPPRQG